MVEKSGEPVEVGSFCHYLQGFGIHPRWLLGLSSINGMPHHQNRMDPANHKFTRDHFDRKLRVFFLEEEPTFEI